jgi:hypothetical protein
MYTICSIICETLSKNEFKIKKIIEIEMVEMGSKTNADPPEFTTLASGLLKDNDELDANKHILNRKIDRLTKSTIGNKTMLPQQVRVRVKAKAAKNAWMIG